MRRAKTLLAVENKQKTQQGKGNLSSLH